MRFFSITIIQFSIFISPRNSSSIAVKRSCKCHYCFRRYFTMILKRRHLRNLLYIKAHHHRIYDKVVCFLTHPPIIISNFFMHSIHIRGKNMERTFCEWKRHKKLIQFYYFISLRNCLFDFIQILCLDDT